MPSWKGVGVAMPFPRGPVVVVGGVVELVLVPEGVTKAELLMVLVLVAVVSIGSILASTQYDWPMVTKFPHVAVMDGFWYAEC